MAEIWKPQPKETYESWCDALYNEASEKLSDWEIDFITSIKNQLQYRDLSEKQANILERIYAEKTS